MVDLIVVVLVDLIVVEVVEVIVVLVENIVVDIVVVDFVVHNCKVYVVKIKVKENFSNDFAVFGGNQGITSCRWTAMQVIYFTISVSCLIIRVQR